MRSSQYKDSQSNLYILRNLFVLSLWWYKKDILKLLVSLIWPEYLYTQIMLPHSDTM